MGLESSKLLCFKPQRSRSPPLHCSAQMLHVGNIQGVGKGCSPCIFLGGKIHISTVISIHNCVQDLNQQKSVKTFFCLYKAAPFISLYAVNHVRGQVTERFGFWKRLFCIQVNVGCLWSNQQLAQPWEQPELHRKASAWS